jgi:hypothetical protein
MIGFRQEPLARYNWAQVAEKTAGRETHFSFAAADAFFPRETGWPGELVKKSTRKVAKLIF